MLNNIIGLKKNLAHNKYLNKYMLYDNIFIIIMCIILAFLTCTDALFLHLYHKYKLTNSVNYFKVYYVFT